ncbi:MAG: response regulator [Ruminococcaceae bacterium]|nr:response regulator [Oscillospiraceae bacterium]
MRATYRFAFFLNLIFFIAKSVAAVITGLVLNKYSSVIMIGYGAFAAVIAFVIAFGVAKQRLSEIFHKRLQSIVFIIADLFVGFAFDSAQVMLYSMMLTSVVLFTFIDGRLMKFYTINSYVFQLVCVILIQIILDSPQSVLEMNFGIITTAVANWVFVGMIDMIVYKNRQYAEQERSLDDLLNLVEKKCDESRAATKSKTAFFAVMSHEIRTPINAIMGMNETILRESKEKNIKEYALETKTAADSLLSIVNDILDVTKIEESKLKIISVRYSMPSMFTDIYNLIKFRAETKQLELVLDIDENLPSEAYGDDVRLKQVLVNLLTNAVKYTHTGTVTFTARRESEDMFFFSVKDTGIGIKSESMDTLFDMFARMDEIKNRNIEGTGLGLSITATLLKLQNSELKVKSEYGEGSEFYFTIKQRVADNTPIGKFEPGAHNHEYKEYVTAYTAPDAHILVVDDNAINRKVFINLLKPMKIKITEAASGKECIELIKKTKFDIVFMDHMMPEMDGLDTFEIMKAMDDNLSKDAPVIMLTANAMAGAKEMYLKAGFKSMLTKPINPATLEKKIMSLLPAQYIKPVEAEKEEVLLPKTEELPMISGIDWRLAHLNLGDNAAIFGTVKMFISAIKADVDELNGYYQMIARGEGTEETLKNYRVKVHSMKSSALLIGIISLAGMAMRLEQAAAENDSDTIVSMHPAFADSYLSFYEPLSALVKPNTETFSAKADMDKVNEIIDNIKKAAEALDVDALDSLSAQLDGYAFEGDMKTKIEEIKTAIFNFETDKLRNVSLE